MSGRHRPLPGHDSCPDLDLLPTWAPEQKAAANRQVITVMQKRLAAGEEVARMYVVKPHTQKPGCGYAAFLISTERTLQLTEGSCDSLHRCQ